MGGRRHGQEENQAELPSPSELNLLQLATVAVAQLRAGSPQVVRCNMFQARSLAADLDDVPHNILRDTFPPYLVGSRHRSKDPSVRDLGRQRTATCLWR